MDGGTHSRWDVGPAQVEIHADDGYALGATVYHPAGRARSTVLVHGATGVPQTYYRRFAQHLAARDARVITYDYRGIGASLHGHVRDCSATMLDWAGLDAAAALRFARSADPRAPLYTVGHSFGGQLLALVDEARAVDGAITVGAQFGWYGHWPWPWRAPLGLFWRVGVPAVVKAAGYLPEWVGLGENLPAGVARQWAGWCRNREYALGSVPRARQRIASVTAPILAFSFSDDTYAPPGATAKFHSVLPQGSLRHLHLRPGELGVKAIGHFGFFRPSIGLPLWHQCVRFVGLSDG